VFRRLGKLLSRKTMVKKVAFGSDTAEFFLRFVLLEKIGLGGGRELVYNLFHVHCAMVPEHHPLFH